MARRAKDISEYLNRPSTARAAAHTAAHTAALSRSARILGIDPGSRLCGWGVIEAEGPRLKHLAHGVVKTGTGSLAARLAVLHSALTAVIAAHAPGECAIEDVFVKINPATALILGQARGVALLTLGQAGLAPAHYAPTQVKSAVTGLGRADKLQVQHMVRLLLKHNDPIAADAADALAIAICHAHTRTAPY